MTIELPRPAGQPGSTGLEVPTVIPFIGGFETTYVPEHDVDVRELTGVGPGWERDLDALVASRVRKARYATRWHRIEETPGVYDWRETDAELAAMRDRGIAPILDLLHHTSVPRWLEDGLRDPGLPPAFVSFVEAVAHRYPWVEAYTVFNEPTATLMLAGYEGIWPPYDQGVEGFVRLARVVLPAVAAAAARLRVLLPTAEHIWVDTCEHHAGLPGGPAEYAASANDRRHVLLDLLLGVELTGLTGDRPFLASMMQCGGDELLVLPRVSVDVLGLDYYPHSEWWYDAETGHAPSPRPIGFAALAVQYAQRYDLPLMVTETNIRGLPSDRVTWLRYMLEECQSVIEAGVEMRGFCWFPYVDSSDWDSLLARADGRLDPVGVVSPRDGGRRSRSLFTTAWEAAAAGASARALPAFRLQPPCDQQLAGFFVDRDWDWVDAPQLVPPVHTVPPPREREPDLVVFSHLNWDWVWQRPQHLVSRFAAIRGALGGKTWFVEEPRTGAVERMELSVTDVGAGVARVQIVVPGAEVDVLKGFEEVDEALFTALLVELIGIDATVDALVYTPLAASLARALSPRITSYDVMDDLSSFAGAAANMGHRQEQLLESADVVFAGGRTLHALASRGGRSDVHLYPSGVDVSHYAQARTHRATEGAGRPVAGYVGVIDERLDLELIARLAAELPDWTIRMVGPVTKIPVETLPRAANLQYTGMASYDDLPQIMAGFDVAIMPFARNDATRAISPTKTLEYLAAGLPVVSVRLPDIEADYGHVVAFADASTFAQACRTVLDDPTDLRDRLAAAAMAERDWGHIATGMMGHVAEAAKPSGQRTALAREFDDAHVRGVLAATAGLSDAALGPARLGGPGVPSLAAAAVSSASPFLRAPLLIRLSEVSRLHPARGAGTGHCPTCGSEAPCATARAIR